MNTEKNVQINCPKCKERQYSRIDQKYLELFGQCWSCDRKDWSDGKLGIDEFERREKETALLTF